MGYQSWVLRTWIGRAECLRPRVRAACNYGPQGSGITYVLLPYAHAAGMPMKATGVKRKQLATTGRLARAGAACTCPPCEARPTQHLCSGNARLINKGPHARLICGPPWTGRRNLRRSLTERVPPRREAAVTFHGTRVLTRVSLGSVG